MTRQSYAESEIPADGGEQVPYSDAFKIARGFLKHMGEMYCGQITGAGGAGGTLSGIPFEPAAVLIYNLDAGTPFMQFSPPGRLGTAAEQLNIGAAAAAGSAAIPAGVLSGDTYDLTLPTGLAGDGNVVEVIVWGFRDVAGSL